MSPPPGPSSSVWSSPRGALPLSPCTTSTIGYEIRQDSDYENEDAEHQEESLNTREDGEEELVIGAHSSGGKGNAKADKDIVSPHAIDGFWVQRQISEVYPHPVTAADKASSVSLCAWLPV